jgi:hypothetical protein
VAFTAILRPTGTEDGPGDSPHVDLQVPIRHAAATGAAQPEATGAAAEQTVDYATRPAAGSSAVTAASAAPPDDGPQTRKPQANGDSDPAGTAFGRWAAGSLGAPNVRAQGDTKQGEPSAAAEQPPQASAPQTDPEASLTKPAAAHDIQLQVGGEGNSRVEVRVTERAGDVHVSVSTADTRLAGQMRQDLPTLAGRLEQSGFRAETWHPTDAGGRQNPADQMAGADAQDAQSQSRQNGGNEQRDPQQQKPRGPENPDNPSQPKEQGKDFAWLLSSLR